MSERPKLAVVVPNWDGRDFLPACLRSLVEQSVPATVVVVDNGSTDGSSALVQRDFPSVHLIQLDRNYGFTGGVNAGLSWALDQGVDFCALFNNDAIADRDWLEHLCLALQGRSDVGIATGKLLRLNGRQLDSTGDLYSRWGRPYPRGRDELDHGQYDAAEMRDVFAGTGGASLYRVETLRDVGLFDQKFFAYFEDVDISFRARLRGWRVEYVPQARAYHHIGGTSSRISGFARFHAVRNAHFLFWRNMPLRLAIMYFPLFLAYQGAMLFNDMRRGLLRTNLRAHVAAARSLREVLSDRRAIQKGATVGSREIGRALSTGIRRGPGAAGQRPPRPIA